MKKIHLSFLFLLSLSLSAQQQLSLPKHPSDPRTIKEVSNGHPHLRTASVNSVTCLLDSTYDYVYNSTLGAHVYQRTYYNYDAADNCTSTVSYSQDTVSLLWTKTAMSVYSFTINQNYPLGTTFYLWNNTNSSWDNSYRVLHTLDAAFNIVQSVDQFWNGSQWDNNVRYSYTLSVNQSPFDQKTEMWFNQNWLNYSIYENQYSAVGENTLNLSYTWDPNTNTWNQFSKEDVTFDASHRKIYSIDYMWDHINNVWSNNNQFTVAYSNNGLTSTSTRQQWNGSVWKNISRYSEAASSPSVLATQFFEDWNNTTNQWQGQMWDTLLYDANGTYTACFSKRWDTLNASWKNDWDYFLYYDCSQVVTGIDKNSKDSFFVLLYPNPASDQLIIQAPIDFNRLKLVDLKGQLIKEAGSAKSISVSDLPAGIYLVQLYDEYERLVSSNKFVKE